MPTEPDLPDVRLANHKVNMAKIALAIRVAQARESGATWDDIGRVLGITRQTARQRFGPNYRDLTPFDRSALKQS